MVRAQLHRDQKTWLVPKQSKCKIWCMGSHPADKFLSKKEVISHPFWKQKAERAQWICEGWWMKHSSLKHMPSPYHFLSTGVDVLGKNEINCPTTAVWSRESWPDLPLSGLYSYPKNTAPAFWWRLDMVFFLGLFLCILFWEKWVTLLWACFVLLSLMSLRIRQPFSFHRMI